MKRYGILAVFCLALVLSGVAGLGQSEVKDFPVGTTTMVYELKTEDVAAPETITLTVVGSGDGTYRLTLTLDASGTPDENDAPAPSKNTGRASFDARRSEAMTRTDSLCAIWSA